MTATAPLARSSTGPASAPASIALVEHAVECFRRDDVGAAEAAVRRALALDPNDRDAGVLLGLVLHKLGRFAEAETVFEELARRDPLEPSHWTNLGTMRRHLARFDAALSAFARAAELGAADADFYYNVALTHLDRRDYESARAVLQRALELAPRDAEIRFAYARACYELLDTDGAIAALADWESLGDLDTELVAGIGHRLVSLGATDRAHAAIERLAATADLAPRAALTLVQLLERINRLPEARRVLDRVAADPRADEVAVDLALAEGTLAQREGRHEDAVRHLRIVLEHRTDFYDRHAELFLLAKSLDALGRHAEAFEALAEAHRSHVAHLRLAAPAAVARGAPTLDIARYECDPADVARWRDAGGPPVEDSPIFIVAFPRSGTTLLELTLDAHPELVSLDEQPLVQNALDDLLALGIRYPERLADATAEQLDRVRDRYWERARARVALAPGQRLVDKNPLNMLRLPVIRRLWPNARILLAVRHPCDVLLSCYMQHFRAPEFALLCADLRTLAVGYRRTFDFWYRAVECLQPCVREVRYERFVADFEAEVRALASFLDVRWDDAMLAPGRRAADRGYISTPSYAQVVEPVSPRAVGRWRAYERQLAPAMPELRRYLERWGYDGAAATSPNTR